jgi:hypothetical protein
MRHIIKAQFEYHKFSMALALIVIMGLDIGILGWGWTGIRPDIPGICTIMAVVVVVLWFFRVIWMIKEKAERYHATLPIARGEIALARLLVIDLFWLTIFVLFWILFLIIRPQSFQLSIIWYSLSVTGILVAVNAYPFIHRDLFYCFTGLYQKVILTFIYVILLLLATLLFSLTAILRYFPDVPLDSAVPLHASFAELTWMPIGALFFLMLGFGLSYLSLIVFQKRKHYLE